MFTELRKRFNPLRHLVIPGIIFLLGAAAGIAAPAYVTLPWSPAVAVVNGERITINDWHAAMEMRSGEDALEELIQYALIRQEAQRRGVAVEPAAAQQRVDEIRATFQTAEEFRSQLAASGMTEELFKERLYHQMLMEEVVRRGVSVSEEEKRDYFERYGDLYQQSGDALELQYIRAREEDAQEVMRQLELGADFAQLARTYSTDAATRDDGGSMGTVEIRDLEGRFGSSTAQQVLDMGEGEVTGPIEGSEGFYHIFLVVQRHEAAPVTYEDVEDLIEEEIMRQKSRDPARVLEQLRSTAEIRLLRPQG